MANLWNNKNLLLTLKVEEKGDVLVYNTDTEKAEVYILNNDIDKVVSYYKEKKSIIEKRDRHYIAVGENNTKRDVYHYLKPNGPLPTLRLGITKHRGDGTWSSLPHKFELETEPGFEEVFFYLLQGGTKRGLQVGRGVWPDGSQVDAIWPVQDKSWSMVPMGYHPVVGEPGVFVSYIWAYLAKEKRWEKI